MGKSNDKKAQRSDSSKLEGQRWARVLCVTLRMRLRVLSFLCFFSMSDSRLFVLKEGLDVCFFFLIFKYVWCLDFAI